MYEYTIDIQIEDSISMEDPFNTKVKVLITSINGIQVPKNIANKAILTIDKSRLQSTHNVDQYKATIIIAKQHILTTKECLDILNKLYFLVSKKE